MSMKTHPASRDAITLNSVSRRRSGVGRVSKPGRLFNLRLRNSPPMTRTRSPASTHLHQAITALPVFLQIGHRAPQFLLRGRIGDECLSFSARQLEYLFIANDVCDTQSRQAGLLGPKKLAWPAQLQIHFGDVEAVARIHHGSNAFPRGVAEFAGHQDAVALFSSPPHAAAEL